MNKNNAQFIRTDLPESAERLRALGFTEITEPNSATFIFINNGKLVFEENIKNCVFTNRLCI